MLTEFQYLINISARAQRANDDSTMIFIDCLCGEDECKIYGFHFRIFLSRFYLIIHITGGVSEPSSWYSATPLPHETSIEVEISKDLGDEHKEKGNFKITGEYPWKASLESNSERENTNSSKLSDKIKYQDKAQRISVSGSQNNIRWEIKKLPHESHINGPVFVDQKMADVRPLGGSLANVLLKFPTDGVFMTPKKTKNIREKRVLSIFSLVMRKRLCERDHEGVTLSL
ncbi:MULTISPECIES: hypothetical protein [unclassified Rhizobium]|uniref:hypothetical protein n=1 Tax=unclassified Rhizobium TaxID=2613769 RepID=UPI0013C4A090|nr:MULTISPECIES: hypothetical protein [unclassified Rhizobium]